MMKILFVHQKRAHLPEIEAYRKFFTRFGYDAQEVTYEDLVKMDRDVLKNCILWYFMGFYPCLIRARIIIHDYRSLSTGCLPRIKDFLKKFLNHKPDLRIFLNEKVREILNFQDGVPSLLIDMGLPASIKHFANLEISPSYDFVYVGAVTRERDIDKVVRNFLNTYGDRFTLLLVGDYEVSLKLQFKNQKNVVFWGRVAQEKVFELVKSSRYSLCVVPNRYPYYFQTPTKLLEYLALGARVVVNDNPMIMEILHKTGNLSSAYIMDREYRLPPLEWLERLQPASLNIDQYLWENILAQSGIADFLRQKLMG